jgi:hypothetical protein
MDRDYLAGPAIIPTIGKTYSLVTPDPGNPGLQCLFWEWDGNTWTQIANYTGPVGRVASAATYDSACARVVIFGGDDLTSGLLDDT